MTPNDLPETGSPAPKSAPSCHCRVFKMAILGAIVLSFGIVIGSGGTLLWIKHRMSNFFRHHDQLPAEFTERIRDRLKLSGEQTARVTRILEERHQALTKLHHEMRQNVQAEIERIRSEVAAILTPEQAPEWNEHFDSILKLPHPPKIEQEEKTPESKKEAP